MLWERDLWKAPYKRLLTTNTTAKLQGVEPRLCISQLKRAPPDIWSCANAGDHESNQPGREVADIMVGHSLPRGLRTFLSTPFPNCYPRKASLGLPTHVLWIFLQPGKRMLLLSHNRVWHTSEDPVVCPSQTPPWCPERQFLWSKLNLLSIISRPWVYFSTSGWQPPSRGNTASRCWVEKGTPAQNHPCRSWHFPSWASD